MGQKRSRKSADRAKSDAAREALRHRVRHPYITGQELRDQADASRKPDDDGSDAGPRKRA